MKNTSTKKVQGIGTNDADYKVEEHFGGIRWKCPFYKTWTQMLRRTNGIATPHSPLNGYENATVCEEWTLFSNFRKWMELQEWKGMHLDKDLKSPGNKIYSPENCTFIPEKLNKVIAKKKKTKSIYLQGVSRRTNRFRAMMNIDGKNTHLGYFDTEMEAHIVYSEKKYNYLQGFIGVNDKIDSALEIYLMEFRKYIDRKHNGEII